LFKLGEYFDEAGEGVVRLLIGLGGAATALALVLDTLRIITALAAAICFVTAFAVNHFVAIRKLRRRQLTTLYQSTILPSVSPGIPANQASDRPSEVTAMLSHEPSARDRSKIYISITPDEVVDLFRDRTTMEGRRLFAPYKDKWYRCTGQIENVKDEVVTLADSPNNIGTAFMFSDAHEISKLETLRKGETVTIDGQLNHGESMRIVFYTNSIIVDR